MGPYNDIVIRRVDEEWLVLVREDWRTDDAFSQRNGWRVDTAWGYKTDAERRVAFLSKEKLG